MAGGDFFQEVGRGQPEPAPPGSSGRADGAPAADATSGGESSRRQSGPVAYVAPGSRAVEH